MRNYLVEPDFFKVDFILYDHQFFHAGDFNLSFLLLNDNLQIEQKIWYRNNELPLFYSDMMLLREKVEIFNFKWPDFLQDNRELLRLIKRLLNKNRLYKTGIITLKLVREENHLHYLARATPHESNHFPFGARGLLMDFSDFVKYSENRFSSYDIFNLSVWNYASAKLNDTQYGNAIFLNQKGYICEVIGANIFFIKGKSIITPSPESGCYIDPIRQKILEAAIGIDFQVIESAKITKEQVYGMEEVFISSEANGIQWIIGIESKRYFHSWSDEISMKLDEILARSV